MQSHKAVIMWQVMSHPPEHFLILLASGFCYRQKDRAYANETTIRIAMIIISILNNCSWWMIGNESALSISEKMTERGGSGFCLLTYAIKISNR